MRCWRVRRPQGHSQDVSTGNPQVQPGNPQIFRPDIGRRGGTAKENGCLERQVLSPVVSESTCATERNQEERLRNEDISRV